MTGSMRPAAAMTAIALAALLAAPAPAQGIKINDSTTLRVGLLAQTWADWSENVRQDTSYAQNVFERRIRLGPGGNSAQADFIQYDGDTFFTALPKQNDYLVEVGYYIPSIKIMPWLKVDGRSYDVTSVAAFQNEHRIQVGGTYYMMGHNLNVKAAYARNSFDRLNLSTLDQNQFTVQLQGFPY
ncbi:MAG: hypothetical protein ACR2OG_12775 [Gemmatimonadaceae bacterium]